MMEITDRMLKAGCAALQGARGLSDEEVVTKVFQAMDLASASVPALFVLSPPVASIEIEFDQWYRVYPRRSDRGRAEKAFPKARKLASLETLIAGARRYAEAVRGEDQKFTKQPATWLNGKCWLDEPAPFARSVGLKSVAAGIADALNRSSQS